jgi:hypothetical protein
MYIYISINIAEPDVNMSQYIYLLQEREFIKTGENIYKVGMTTKNNFERFNQYPKGSVLLFQIICNDCKSIEKKVLKKFNKKFKIRKDIGNEYFEGKYKNMIKIIYSTIKKEDNSEEEIEDKNEEEIEDKNEEEIEDKNEEEIEDKNEEEIEDKREVYTITTYEEWSKCSNIGNIIIKSKNGEGHFRFNCQIWRQLYDKYKADFDENNMEDLSGLVGCNQPIYYKVNGKKELLSCKEYHKLNYTEKTKIISVEYDVDKIIKDIINKCNVNKDEYYEEYNLDYSEYVFSLCGIGYSKYVIFNSKNFTFNNIDELINNKILTGKNAGGRMLYSKSICNINIVDDILNSLIKNETKNEYKKLVYNLIVEQEEKQIIFYDYNECLLSVWINDLLYSISGCGILRSCDYYRDKTYFKNLIKNNRCYNRCVIIVTGSKKIETQIHDFVKLGFKNIIVHQDNSKKIMYNIENYRNYLQYNKDLLIKCINEENNDEPIDVDNWKYDIQHDDSIFYSQKLLLTNFLKWCCNK